MKKLFLILFLFFSFENISYSQDLNEILKRLDKIDKRLSDIEDKMKFFDILSGLETSGLDKTNENIDNSLWFLTTLMKLPVHPWRLILIYLHKMPCSMIYLK